MTTILIVEDDDHLSEIYQAALQLTTMDITVVGDGSAAIEWLRDQSPRIVLLDLNLPNVSGLEVLAWMRRHDHLRSTWVIVTTANAVQAATLRDRSDAFLLTLIKPVSLGDLRQLVDRLLKMPGR
jgi:DNA-binding response OmpR family regulator